jgi:hypothetical protein
MNVRRFAALGAVALAASALLTLSCSKKPTGVDASYTTPEGRPSDASRLTVWTTSPNSAARYTDLAPIGPGPEDVFLGTASYRRYPDGTLLGMLFDGTQASGFQVLRREPNGGLVSLDDFVHPPTRRWLDGKWELYEFIDPQPSSPTYIGRGLIAGQVTESSPLTNEAKLGGTTTVSNIPLSFPTDTTVLWGSVTGAAVYIAHIYQLREAPPLEQILSGAPAPIYRGLSRDFFLGIPDTPQTIGRNLPFAGTVLTRRDMPPAQYLARISAIDANGQLIAYSVGDSLDVTREGGYERFPSGAAILPRHHIGTGPGRVEWLGPAATVPGGPRRRF